MAILIALCITGKQQLQLGHHCPVSAYFHWLCISKEVNRQPNCRHLSIVGHVERYPTMQYFGIPVYTKLMIAYITFWSSSSVDFDLRLHYGNTVSACCCRHVQIRHVNEYHTMHYSGNPRHTQSMIAYMILTEYFWKFQWKIALWECC